MKRLIVNADDFGFTGGVNAGILHAYTDGIVTSTTLMACGAAFEEAVEIAQSNKGLGVGCHLVAVGEKTVAPVSSVPSLVDADSRLPRTVTDLAIKIARGQIKQGDIEIEFRAQLTKLSDAGITPTHLDTHKHAHVHPVVLKAVLKVAREFGIAKIRRPFQSFSNTPSGPTARESRNGYMKQHVKSLATLPLQPYFNRATASHGIKTPKSLYGVSLTGMLDVTSLNELLSGVDDGVTELMCHPGIHDSELENAGTRLKESRARELEALTDHRVAAAVREKGITLIGYGDL